MNILKLFANYYRHEKKICFFFVLSFFFANFANIILGGV